MDRATTWSAANDGDLGMIQEALDASQIYQDNTIEVRIFLSNPRLIRLLTEFMSPKTPEMLTKALLYEKYSQACSDS